MNQKLGWLCLWVSVMMWMSIPQALATPPLECQQDNDCKTTCDAKVTELQTPRKELTKFLDHKCMELGQAGQKSEDYKTITGCGCALDSSFTTYIFLGKPSPTNDGCMVRGRDQSCLYKEADFPGCDLKAATTSCQSICSNLEKKIQADEQAKHQASTHKVTCIQPGSCGCSLKLNNLCYFSFGPTLKLMDCNESHQDAWNRLNGFNTNTNTTPGNSKGMGCSIQPDSTQGPKHFLIWMMLLLGWGVVMRRRLKPTFSDK